jgi:hypothetical protein
MDEQPQPGTQTPVPRKPYWKPKLEVYGNVREITAHVGNAGTHADPPPHAGFRFTTR